MRVIKLTEHAPIIDADGKWNVFCMVQKGGVYQYGAIVCKTMQEALSIKEGQILDTDKTDFDSRTKNG